MRKQLKSHWKFGVIGCNGKMGNIRIQSIADFYESHNIDLCVYDTEVDKTTNNMAKYTSAWKSSNIVICKDTEDVINKSDIIFVCVPPLYAADYVLFALEKHKHVFCEKPPCIEESKINDIFYKYIKLTKPPYIYYGFNHRWHHSVQLAKQFLSYYDYKLGKLLNGEAIYAKDGSLINDTDWRKQNCGILLDQGIHLLDVLALLLGNIYILDAKGRFNDRGLETHIYARIGSTAYGINTS